MNGLLGDSVMSIPLVLELKRLWPDIELDILARKSNVELLRRVPVATCVIELPGLPFRFRDWGGGRRLKNWVKSRNYDLAIIALGDDLAVPLAAAGIPARVGVKGTPTARCLSHVYDIGSPRLWGPEERLAALGALGLVHENPTPTLRPLDQDVEASRGVLGSAGLRPDAPFVLVHPYGSTARQHWTRGGTRLLAEELRDRGYQTAVIGGPEHVEARHLDSPIVDLVGRLEVAELIAAMSLADAVISTDSGPFHIAGAVGAPTLGLFRASRPEHAQRYPTGRAVFGDDPSCRRDCDWDRCAQLPCRSMGAISAEVVLASLDDMLRARG